MSVAADHLSALCTVLNGLTILSDWIASNEDYFPCAGEVSLGSYSVTAWSQALHAVEDVGLLRFPQTPENPTFARLFPQLEPRPLQAALDVDALQDVRDPMLAVIEAPTGEGKTEAALLLAERLIGKAGGGMYFALPTMATSEQLFGRVAAFISQAYPEAGATGVMLVHGQSDISPSMQQIDLRSQQVGRGYTDPIVVDSWFLPRKRALLAPFAVGTVDQAMLAALRVRHGSLRLFGLAGKVVIIDEIHAYDAYMSVIIERLLEWLAELGVSVILLSATLTAASRRRYLEAYGAAESDATGSNAYPLITLARPGEEAVCLKPAVSNPGRSVSIELLSADQRSLAIRDAAAAAAKGAAVGWVCDTVGSAQETFSEIRTALEWESRGGNARIVLYHARMFAGRRRDVEKLVERIVGKNGERDSGSIIVATQVVEQSLDIDFDVLFTELAPVDLLIQRIGRLHRHERVRPKHVSRPQCRVLLPERLGGSEPATAIEWVYQPFILIKTLAELLQIESISVPGDVRRLVESAYDDAMLDDETLAAVGVSAEDAMGAWAQLVSSRQIAADAAGMFVLGPPAGDRFTSGDRGVPLLDQLGDDDVLERESVIGAQTRLSAPSARVILLDGDHQLLDGRSELFNDRRLPADLARWLLDRSVSISHWALLHHIADGPSGRAPKSFDKTPALRNHTLLRMVNDAYQWQVRGRTFHLEIDEVLGVVIKGEDGSR